MSSGYHVRMAGLRTDRARRGVLAVLNVPNRESALIFFWFCTVFFAFVTISTTVYLVADLRGGNATATVVHVYSQESYRVTFVTRDGTHCQADHKWNARPERINVSDTFRVHYSSLGPCENFRRADDRSFWSTYPILPVLLAASVVGLLLLREKRYKDDRFRLPRRF
jgi:hypothetical protein